MKEKEKNFILNRGLYLGLFLSVFPFIDLVLGDDMSLRTYHIIFTLLGFISISYLLYFYGKEYKISSHINNFKSIFRIMFLVSFMGLLVLTFTRITLWNALYPQKYIEINESRKTATAFYLLGISQSFADYAYTKGSIPSDKYEELNNEIEKEKNKAKDDIKEYYDLKKEIGITKLFFINKLINNLFSIAILNVILAFFIIRR